jgi:DNA-binding NtrC family response regulator
MTAGRTPDSYPYLLVVTAGDGVFSTPLAATGRIVLGRSETCDVCVPDQSVSRHHVALELGDEFWLEELGSANGTRVNDQWIDRGARVPLGIDETFTVGDVTAVIQRRAEVMRRRCLWVHDYFEARVDEECVRAERTAEQFVVVRVRGGPDVGESRLRDTLLAATRAYDTIGEYVPCDFEVLLTSTARDRASDTVARIHDALRAAGLTCSVGVACYPEDGRNGDALIGRAATAARGNADGVTQRSVDFVAEDSRMQKIHRMVERIAASTINVLVLGETGVGKELIAEKISARSEQRFLCLNCAALSEPLLESELFGHERGAFTGAVQTKQGLLETAQGGTVFLDEIGELPLSLQAKLLRVIEERRVLRVGGLESYPIDVRFVAATNREPEREVERGNFRQDLYFRLNGVTLLIPPLRQRVSEIEGLVRVFVRQFAPQLGRDPSIRVSDEAMALLKRYPWPGNIRELRNVVERALVLCTDDYISVDHLPVEKMRSAFVTSGANVVLTTATPVATKRRGGQSSATPSGSDELGQIRTRLVEAEKRRVIEALEQCAGNQTHAAELLGVSRRTLINRIDKYGIPRPRKKRP